MWVRHLVVHLAGALSARRSGRPGKVTAWLFFCGAITGTGKRLGPDHIGVLRAGRKDLMPGALAPNPRPVDTDPLHCFHLLGQPPISGAQQAHRVMARVAPGWVSGIA